MPETKNRIPALDGVRGAAISLVLVYHALYFFADFPTGSVAARALALTRLWWNGVDLFFVLSGFLIGGILLDARSSPRYYQTFYARRAFRILPLYFFVLVLYVVTASRLPLFGVPLPIWSYVPMLQNFFIAATGTFGVAWLGVTWSLAVEEQFYLVAPFLIRKLSSPTLERLVIATILVAPVLRLVLFYSMPMGYIAAMVLVFSRADVLMWGVGVAMIVRKPALMAYLAARRTTLASTTILLAITLLWFTLKNWSIASVEMVVVGYSVQGLFFGSLLFLVLQNLSSPLSQMFALRPLRFLGERAYGIYLLHVPAIYLAFMLAGYKAPRISNQTELSISIGALIIAVAAASLSWRFVERPLIARGHRYLYRVRTAALPLSEYPPESSPRESLEKSLRAS